MIFLHFLQFETEFGNKEFMIWATVSSWSCFCWPYRASPSSAEKNIKSKEVPENHLLLLYWLRKSLWLCGLQQTVENSSRDGNTRSPYLPPEKPTCRSRSNSKNQTWNNRLVSKMGKKYVKAVYCHSAYLTYMQSTSWEMPGWMKHKLESRVLG